MILGRNAGLWSAAVAALLNVGVFVLAVPLTAFQVGILNVAALAIVGLVANRSDPTTAPTFAATLHGPTAAGVSGAGASGGAGDGAGA